MEKNNFILYKNTEKILNDNMFFGFTVKREKNNRLVYKYHSVKYPKVTIQVLTLKLKPNQIPSEKIVLGIKFNDTEINGWKELVKGLKEMYKFNKKSN